MNTPIKMKQLRGYHRAIIAILWLLWWYLLPSDEKEATFIIMVVMNFLTGIVLEKINQTTKHEN